jgi:hypothetical protein
MTPVDDFHLFLSHVRGSIIEEQLLVLMHAHRAAIDEEHDQNDTENAPSDQQPEK